MAFFLRHIARQAAHRLAQDPRTREMASRAAKTVVEESRRIAGEEDRARAAGRSVRRAFNRLRDDRSS